MADTLIEARVTGKVQGVWFRAWTREQAVALGLRGWVRNEPDGAVRALLVGPEATVKRMVDLLHQGPDRARVDAVETRSATIAADGESAGGFEIRR
ncbi:acylphosphatase [Psychromarinibacter sp. S121]|uniref:acylphosphatase n=1 Tax=Psychromarinibacter sp. S121 TaxID=3415127 RepID=UPI003C7B47F2